MRVLVSDTSVLVDLERANLLPNAFQLAVAFAVPDVLYERELRSLVANSYCSWVYVLKRWTARVSSKPKSIVVAGLRCRSRTLLLLR